MRRLGGVALLAVGVILFIMGVNAADSFSSEVSEFFEGTPSDKSIWLLIGGAAAGMVGLVLVAFPDKH